MVVHFCKELFIWSTAPQLNLPLLIYVSLTPMVVAASWLVGSRIITVRKRGSPDARAKAPQRRGQSHWRNSLPLLSPVLGVPTLRRVVAPRHVRYWSVMVKSIFTRHFSSGLQRCTYSIIEPAPPRTSLCIIWLGYLGHFSSGI
ncbi:hypothetical protein EDC04DRAFT_2031649 [Pisolithus marmoratus]|nr:hypothetical protein EDC04DRAFT_2031649 [Pisolithus marmoratus]